MSREHLTYVIFMALSVVVANTARAQSDDAYRSAMADASTEYDAGHWQEARALLLRAHAIHADARTLLPIAQADFELREYVDCVRHVRAALADTVHPLRSTREGATGLLARARAFVGEYHLTIDPADATVTVDDETVPTTESLLLLIGTHSLVAHASGHDDLRRTIRTAGGEDDALTLTLAPTTRAPIAPTTTDGHVDIATPQVDIHTPAVTAGRDAAPARSHRDSTSSDLSAAGVITLVAAGLVVGAMAGGIGWWAVVNDRIGRCNMSSPPCTPTTNAGNASEQQTALGFAIGMGVAGALALGVGVALIVVSGNASNSGEASVTCGTAGIGVSCGGTF